MKERLVRDVVGKELGHAGTEARADVRAEELDESRLERVRFDGDELPIRRDLRSKALIGSACRVP